MIEILNAGERIEAGQILSRRKRWVYRLDVSKGEVIIGIALKAFQTGDEVKYDDTDNTEDLLVRSSSGIVHRGSITI